MAKQKRRQFSREYKEEAVRMVTGQHMPLKKAAEQLEINVSLLNQ
jgi:transposase-like protein